MTQSSSTLTFLDSYCERAGDSGLWAEPLNAVTNLAFIIAALCIVRRLLKAQMLRWRFTDMWLLTALLAAIGVGSGLWHTHATQATMLADVIPIVLFMNLYLLVCLRRVLQLRWAFVVLGWGLFQAANIASEIYLPRDTLNGSIMYVPTFLTLAALCVLAYRRSAQMGSQIAQCLLIFAASLLFRTIDLGICTQLPIGTHFLWHLLNAYLLYRLLQLAIHHTSS